ncbi:MAG: hypothetical protein ACI9WU_003184 [Myxococcota bacterium]|jgi:hypothetical protein
MRRSRFVFWGLTALSAGLVLSGCEVFQTSTDASSASAGTGQTQDIPSAIDTFSAPPPPDTGFGEIIAHVDVDFAEDLVQIGNTVLVAAKSTGLLVFDVSNPAAPTEVTRLFAGGDDVWDLATDSDGRAYVAHYESGVHVLQVTGNTVTALGSHAPGWRVISVAPLGNRLYIGGGDGTRGVLAVLDIANPASPSPLGSFQFDQMTSACSSLAARDTTVFCGRADGHLIAFDASNPAEPVVIGDFFEPGTPGHEPWGLGITLLGNTLYYADWGAGMLVVDTTNPQAMTALHTYANNHAIYDVALGQDVTIREKSYGRVAYVGGDMGIDVLDVTDPSKTTLIENVPTRWELDDSAHGVVFDPASGYGYVADNKEQSLTVIRLVD